LLVLKVHVRAVKFIKSHAFALNICLESPEELSWGNSMNQYDAVSIYQMAVPEVGYPGIVGGGSTHGTPSCHIDIHGYVAA
jgi:hypothetical protein